MERNYFDAVNRQQMIKKYGKEYAEYDEVPPNQLPFHIAEDKEELNSLRKSKMLNSLMLLLIAVGITIAIGFSIYAANMMALVIASCAAVLIWIGFFGYTFQKASICEARVIQKNEDFYQGSQYLMAYFVTVSVTSPNRLISENIKISKRDYRNLSIGDTVYIVNESGFRAFLKKD